MEKRDMKHRPHPDYRYWLYDPEGGGMTYYRTKDDRDKAGNEAVGAYLEDGWADEVEYVAAGEVPHSAQCLDKNQRPDDLDEVMEQQKDLVEVVKHIKPLINVKG